MARFLIPTPRTFVLRESSLWRYFAAALSLIAACAAARRATGTRYGEQLT